MKKGLNNSFQNNLFCAVLTLSLKGEVLIASEQRKAILEEEESGVQILLVTIEVRRETNDPLSEHSGFLHLRAAQISILCYAQKHLEGVHLHRNSKWFSTEIGILIESLLHLIVFLLLHFCE